MADPRTVSEAQLQESILELAEVCGWTRAHFRAVRIQRKDGSVYYETPVAADGVGWPDLVLVHPRHGVLYRELKSATGRLSDDQRAWLDVLTAAGADAAVWRPDDWDDIAETLTGATS